jgi:hypothetical protein
MALIRNKELPKGVRKIEFLLPDHDLELMKGTMAEHNAKSCLTALRNSITFYRTLRESIMPPSIKLNNRAEQAVMTYLSDI